MLSLNTWMFSFLKESKYLTQNDRSFDKKRTYFEAVNNLKSILEDMKIYVVWFFWTICWWHRLMLPLIYPWFDLWPMLSFALKKHKLCFTFALVIFNLIFLILVLNVTWSEILVVRFFWNYLAIIKPWIIPRFGYVLHITQFVRNISLILTISVKYSFSWVLFPKSWICKNVNVISNLVNKIYS